jgi:ABC-2 type transport system permease protein
MSPGTYWTGTRLVAGRAITEGGSSKSWRVVTALMLLIGLAVVIVPRMIGERQASYTLATVGPATPALVATLEAFAQAGEFDLEMTTVPDPAAAQQAVRDGAADAALTDEGPAGTLYVAIDGGGTFPALVAQAALATATTQALADAGLSPAQIAAIQATPPPEQVPIGQVADQGRAGVGFAVGIVLYMSLILTGTTIATAVATEKSTRISEVLLAVLRPTQLLVGTVLGAALLGLAQIAMLAIPAGIGVATSSSLSLPASAASDIALGVAWFALGVSVYAFAFAALGSLVEKPTEVGSAILPMNVVLIGSYLLAVIVTVRDPDSWASVIASVFPLSAPLVMPFRWASGLVPAWQLVLAMALTAAAAVGLALLASRIYARGIARTGRRLKLREVLTD